MSSAQTDHQDISRFFITTRLKSLHMKAPLDCALPNAEAVHAKTRIKKLEASELLSVSYTMTWIEIRHLDPSISLLYYHRRVHKHTFAFSHSPSTSTYYPNVTK